MKNIFRLSALTLTIILSATLMFAQQPTATLTGVVTDANGAVIPGATVLAASKGTGFTRSVATNNDGVYVISSLPVGKYEVRISANAFTTAILQDILLNVGQTVTRDVSLMVGSISATTELIGEMPLIDTSTSKVDAVIDHREIENLPLNGRNFLELALLTPGNTIAPNFDPTKTNTVLNWPH